MKRALITIFLTVAVFSAGVLTGRWMQRTQPVPPPPIGIMGEIRDVPLSASNAPATPKPDLQAEVDRMKPHIEAFKQKLEPIKQGFRNELDAVLTADQRLKLQQWNERTASGGEKKKHKDGLDSLFPIVIVPSTLDRLTDELHLTDDQRTRVHQLLLERREKFLALVDASPPPSLRLSRIAPLIPQAAKPDSK